MLKDEVTDPKERRKEGERFPVEINVDLSTLGAYHLTKILNISTGGIFICHDDIKPVGTMVTISFKLPNDNKPIEIEAQVAWSYRQAGRSANLNTGMGFKFTKVLPSDQKKIEDYIAQLLLLKPKRKR